MTKVSIIIPTYKSRGGLSVSVDSAIKQTYPEVEIIVVDDNSPDSQERIETEQIMIRYANEPRVKYIKHPENRNGASARNTGISYSSGDYIAFLDDDDEFFETKIERQVAYLESHSEFAAVYNFSFVNGKKEIIHPYEGDASIPLLMCRTKMFTPSLMFRKQALVAIGGFDEGFKRHQDYELLLKFFAGGYKIGCIQEYLTMVHSLGGNKPDANKSLEIKDRFLDTFERVISRLEGDHPGIRKKIVAANYEAVFESCISQHKWRLAFELFRRYFFMSPTTFTRNFIHSNYIRLKRKMS